jgi:hypothetical protein
MPNHARQSRPYNSLLRYFFSRQIPPFTRILLVESGSRTLLNKLIPVLQQIQASDPAGASMEIDLVTCYAGVPERFQGRVYHVSDYSGPSGRQELYDELARRNYTLCGIICSAEPIMTKWKWMLAARLKSKVFIINENADFFWLDRGHIRQVLHLMFYRAGMTGSSAIPALVRLIFFPLTLLYLLAYAGTVHLQRKIRTL